jgi:hypothetical protein
MQVQKKDSALTSLTRRGASLMQKPLTFLVAHPRTSRVILRLGLGIAISTVLAMVVGYADGRMPFFSPKCAYCAYAQHCIGC